MWKTARTIASDAAKDLRRCFRILAITDLTYKAIAFALLTPGTALLLYWLRSGTTYGRVMADADIARFFVTTRMGFLSLVLGASLVLAITALESACLMAIGLAAARGTPLNARSALAFAATRAPNILRLTANIVARVLAVLLPFLIAVGLVYKTLLKRHDINYYLAERPPEFLAAVALVALLVTALAILLVRMVGGWALALPLVLFEDVSPRRALGESGRRSVGDRNLIVTTLAAWALLSLGLLTAARWLPEYVGLALAPKVASSLVLLLIFLAGLLILWAALALAVGIFNFSLFSLLITHLYLSVGEPKAPKVPTNLGQTLFLSRRLAATLTAIVALGAIGLALLAFQATRQQRPVLVIAHRGASAAAPENTLAAFRLAVEEKTDFYELDVQESTDGEVVVVHDSDLMKVGGAPMKIWETDAQTLRSVDIGSHRGKQFSAERVPTLAEALEVARGKARVVVELKSYGHDERLEERVAAIVEAAGMEKDCIYMSLDHEMVKKMKRLRPSWRVGILVAKAVGDLTVLHGDFLAVEARMATRRFVRRAHAAGQDVYVWTVNDPAWMLAVMGRGVDGLITDEPGLARRVIERRAQMSDAQRFLVALLVRLGASTETLAAEDALRP